VGIELSPRSSAHPTDGCSEGLAGCTGVAAAGSSAGLRDIPATASPAHAPSPRATGYELVRASDLAKQYEAARSLLRRTQSQVALMARELKRRRRRAR
jgi:hypothetical protein